LENQNLDAVSFSVKMLEISVIKYPKRFNEKEWYVRAELLSSILFICTHRHLLRVAICNSVIVRVIARIITCDDIGNRRFPCQCPKDYEHIFYLSSNLSLHIFSL